MRRFQLLVPLALLTLPSAVAPQDTSDAALAWIERIAHDDPGVWITSNEEWEEADGGVARYGLDWWALPGGSTALGCLWSEYADGSTSIAWRFQRIWDPIEGRGLVHQIGPSGAVAFGWQDPLAPELELIQMLVPPSGPRMELRHTQTDVGDDVHLDRSWTRSLGATEWTPSRSYRWERRLDLPSPCRTEA